MTPETYIGQTSFHRYIIASGRIVLVHAQSCIGAECHGRDGYCGRLTEAYAGRRVAMGLNQIRIKGVFGGVEGAQRHDNDEANANRDLIVQAPVMLVRLKQALEFVGLHTVNGAPNQVDVITDPEQMRDLIEAVIAAVEGK